MAEDEELAAMSAIASALHPLDLFARKRTLAWALSRFGGDATPNSSMRAEQGPKDYGEASGREPVRSFETFAELFAACGSKTESDKALLAAYWVQVVNNHMSFAAQALNTELKDLGHGIGNITEALSALKNERPSLALQLKKSGSSRQARKTYKLTQEGIRRVRSMIADDISSGESN